MRPVTETEIKNLTILCCICVFSNFANFEDGKGIQTAGFQVDFQVPIHGKSIWIKSKTDIMDDHGTRW